MPSTRPFVVRRPGDLGAVAALAQDRDAEVDDARQLGAVRVALDDHVLGLEVAVDQPRFVRVIEALEQLARQVDDPRSAGNGASESSVARSGPSAKSITM